MNAILSLLALSLLILSTLVDASSRDDEKPMKGFLILGLEGGAEEELESQSAVLGRVRSHRRARQLKGSSKGGKNGKSNGGDDDSFCDTLEIYALTKDVINNVNTTADGYVSKFDVFEKGSTAKLGSWYESVQFVNAKGTDGVGYGVLAFNLNTAMSFSGTLKQRQLPIDGGSGQFVCSTGFIEPIKTEGARTFFDVNYCLMC